MATPQRQEALYKEGRLILALQAYKLGQIKTLEAAAKIYDVPPTTARRRAAGVQPKRGSHALNRLLTPVQEDSLRQWILSMDQRGMQPRIATVRQMASILATQRTGSTTPLSVGQCWVSRFIKRHDDLQSKYNRKYDYQRAKCEDPVLI